MQKSTLHYWLDVLLGLLAMLLAVSSFLLWVVFPRGFHATRMLWVAIHKWGGLAVCVVALAHVLLHRRWLLRMTRRRVARVLSRFTRKTPR